MPVECTTATALKAIEQAGWEIAPCPHLHWLDELGHHIIVRLHSEYGLSAFELKYDPKEKDFTYFRALDPLDRVLILKG